MYWREMGEGRKVGNRRRRGRSMKRRNKGRGRKLNNLKIIINTRKDNYMKTKQGSNTGS